MYTYGIGVAENYVQAYAWLNLPSAQGNKKALEFTEFTRKQMTPAQLAEAQKLSKTLCAKIPYYVHH